jgi:hypothetical protein
MKRELDGGYLVYHEHISDQDSSYVKFIGLFQTKKAAKLAVERLKQQPGFKENPKGFTIDFHKFDKENWTEGFVSDYYI